MIRFSAPFDWFAAREKWRFDHRQMVVQNVKSSLFALHKWGSRKVSGVRLLDYEDVAIR